MSSNQEAFKKHFYSKGCRQKEDLTQLYKESATEHDTSMQATISYHHEQAAHILSMLLNREYQQLKSDEHKVTPSKHAKKISYI